MKKISSVISTLLMILMIAAVAVFAVPRVFGVEMFSVLTPSMTPAYPPGTLIFAVPKDYEEIKVGDVVTYLINDNLDVLTHRVVEKDDVNRTVTTHGDANDEGVNDAPAKYENIIGVVKFSVPKLGFIATFLSTTYGKIIGIAAVVLLALISFLIGGDKKKANTDSDKITDKTPKDDSVLNEAAEK